MKTTIHDSCLKRNVRIYISGMLLHFCIPDQFFSCNIWWNMKFCQVPHCKVKHMQLVSFLHLCTEQTLHLLNAAPLFSSLGGTWTILQLSVSPADGQLVPSLTVICVSVVLVLFTSNLVICLDYFSHLLSLLPLSFSEQSQVWYPWKHRICPFDFDLWCIF
jgi:hypothetical protein